jgi:hypothetical protein
MSAEQRSRAAVIEFPDPALRHALAVLRDESATELEIALASSVVLLAVRQGVSVPTWAAALVAAARRRGRSG